MQKTQSRMQIQKNKKKTLALVFGGRSNEHEISCLSAVTIAKCVDNKKWDLILIGITKEGRWIKVETIEDIEKNRWEESLNSAFILPDASLHGVLIKEDLLDTDRKSKALYENQSIKSSFRFIYLDVVFPVLHGRLGEDGTIQGLFEMADIPYVGCGVLASAAAMDKLFTKIIVKNLGIRQARFKELRLADIEIEVNLKKAICEIEEDFSYPLFVKPSRSGSSVGVSKVSDRDALIKGLNMAKEVDSKILVEEFIDGRELECAVLEDTDGTLLISGVGEILSADVFYDYDSKYNNPASRTVINPSLPIGTEEKIRKYAGEIFKALDGFEMARVDFFMDLKTGEVIFNEINTIPGFTAISMYPMLWNAQGISREKLVEKLIERAISRKPL